MLTIFDLLFNGYIMKGNLCKCSSYCIRSCRGIDFIDAFFCGKVHIPRAVCYCDVITGPRADLFLE